MNKMCVHFNDCGGCDWQDKDYTEQLDLKHARIKEIFSSLDDGRLEKTVPSPEIWHYRNKMEFMVKGLEGNTLIGLRRKKKFNRVVDLSECRIFSPDVRDIFGVFKKWMKDCSVEPYKLFECTGRVRYVALRHSKFYDEMMAIVVVAAEKEEFAREKGKYEALVEALKAFAKIKSVYVCINNGVSDVTLSENVYLLYGDGSIREKINGINYLIDPGVFFQTNPFCCAELYKVVKKAASSSGGGAALDLYCGSGGITLQVASVFDKVIGIDIIPGNIRHAEKNRELNQIGNAEFVSEDAELYLEGLKKSGRIAEFSAIIVDPPRIGLTNKSKEIILSSGVKNIIYVSCNPESLKKDLSFFEGVYDILKVTPVDMFPHTRHLEAVAVLKKVDLAL